jgi:hypothetical protein
VTDAAGGTDGPRVLGGAPTEEEAAAIAAVFAQLLLEQAVAHAQLPAEAPPTRWERSIRPLRHWGGSPDADWRSAV